MRTEINTTLKNEAEIEEATDELRKLGSKTHPDRSKNWDVLKIVRFILDRGKKTSNILEVGCISSPVLFNLRQKGFRFLYGIDIGLGGKFENHVDRGLHGGETPIYFFKQNLEKTDFEDNFFDFVISLSVIEHGADIQNYFKEMSRILRQGGFLLTSTDYWNKEVNTTGIYPYGKKYGEMRIFTRKDVHQMIKLAGEFGLRLTAPIDYGVRDKIVQWKLKKKEYTFIFIVLQK